MSLVSAAPAALAEDYPSRPMTVIVPYAAGGPADAIARVVTMHMGATLGATFVIENVVGAGGTTGAARVAKAVPDGYTVLIHNLGLPAAPAFYKALAYDTRTAFETVGLINTGPMVLVSRRGLSADSPQQLWDLLKSKPDTLVMAHAGVGANSHLCGLLLSRALGISMRFVPYRGSGPAMNDLLAEQVDLLCDQSTTAVPQLEAGGVKGFAITSDERLDRASSVPTSAEADLPEFRMTIWHGLYVPKNTPAAAIDVLNRALQKAAADPVIQDRFRQVGTKVFPQDQRSPEAHAIRLGAEIDRWSRINEPSAARPH